ncbi:MAG: RdgB/HAM1 family non-canonical purine NTP pyrophosphatase [Chlorobi bacterium]|nr:RdgB/HAM1 family non-canonical purine NTP pyrophosphatase [Chlorobiota bacterium]
MDIVFATNNNHKLKEIRKLIGRPFRLLSLKDIAFHEEIPEDHNTLEENASEKARIVFAVCGIPTFADDTGLEVESLNNKPGVFSARYAGNDQNDQANIRKILRELKDIENRKARFRTIIALRWDTDKEMLFEGMVNGMIDTVPRGKHGFGYDPVFIPNGYDKSFAQLPLSIKNKISHRAHAFAKLDEYLKNHFV